MATNKAITRKDSRGRVWEYNDAEGTWTHKTMIIGCGGSNGAKYMRWDEPRGAWEYKTLKEAMNNS